MHFQAGIPNWPSVLAVAPEWCLIKGFEGGLLVEAKSRWAALGRDPHKLHADFRFYNFFYPGDGERTFEELKGIWRANFFKFIDRTYLEQYASHIDSVEELNEYTDTRMVTDKALLRPHLMQCQAAVAVWNDEFRGRTVRSADGGEGLIPAECKLVICNSPVGNDVPREFFELAISSDSILGVHQYQKWDHSVRDPHDFRYFSGRVSVYNEQEYGLRPMYLPSEGGPFFDSGRGWRASECLNHNLPLLVSAMQAHAREHMATAAVAEGRYIGPVALFTSGGFGWADYLVDTGELLEVYKMFALEWKGQVHMPLFTNPADTARANVLLDELDALVNQVPFLYQAKTLMPLTLRNATGTAVTDPVLAPTGAVPTGTLVKVYRDNVSAGTYPNRAWISPAGLNVVTVLNGQPTLLKL